MALAKKGIAVALAARSRERLAEVENAIRQIGGRAIAIPTDVSDEAAVETMVESASRELGPIDLW
jgi:NADP-dependent 3-hydroxy acid dehydrogenase YdfG